MIMLLPYSMAQHTYGPDAGEFKPHRWLAPGASSTLPGSFGGAADGDASESRSSSPNGPAPECNGAGAGADMCGGDGVAAETATVASASADKAAASSLPDPFTFLTGPRDW